MKLIIDIPDEAVCKDILTHNLEPQTETDRVIMEALYNGKPYLDGNEITQVFCDNPTKRGEEDGNTQP